MHPYFVCLLCLVVWYLYEPTVMKEPTVRSGAADMEPTVMKEPLGTVFIVSDAACKAHLLVAHDLLFHDDTKTTHRTHR